MKESKAAKQNVSAMGFRCSEQAPLSCMVEKRYLRPYLRTVARALSAFALMVLPLRNLYYTVLWLCPEICLRAPCNPILRPDQP
jgi:hypothetical protein